MKNHLEKFILSLLIIINFNGCEKRETVYDIVIYGGTSAAVVAAVQAKQYGLKVLLISPDKHLGGLSSSGLGFTDTGNKEVIGGLSKEFYKSVYNHYEQDSAWVWQKKEAYGNVGQSTPAIDNGAKSMWIFEPSVAETTFDKWITDNKIDLWREEKLDRNKKIEKNGLKITAIYTLSGKKIEGKMFIDATYEGDLMAAAGVSYHVGREANSVYGEQYNGIQKGVFQHRHNFLGLKINPYKIPDKPESGLLPKISAVSEGNNGDGDNRVQAYCFRMCLTKHAENLVPFDKPKDYNPDDYELIVRIFDAGWRETFRKFDPIPNLKTDVNNHGPFSFDNIGANYDYPDASYERRAEIIAEHGRYQKGLLYFIANDPRIPKDVQDEMKQWGYAKDEFKDNGNFPHQLYIREARRMIGDYVMTENDVMSRKETPNSVGMGSYHLDSHNTQRYITPEGYVENEGDIGVKPPSPYKIAYGAIIPKESECTNLFVPVCVSSSHIAYGSIRMEPVFMILAQSAVVAANIALKNNLPVQKVMYSDLEKELLQLGQVLTYKP